MGYLIEQNAAAWHNHTMYSNIHFRDSNNRIDELINKAIELNLKGLGITDHGVLCSHVEAIKYMKELKEKNPNLDFKLGLGCEIYLIHKEQLEQADENNRIKFYHFILIAKDKKGYEILKKISTRGWENSFTYRGLMRTPVYYEDLEELLKDNNGNLIASSACLGSELSALVLSEKDKEIKQHLDYMRNLFYDDYYIELQPSYSDDQIKYNKSALKYAKELDIKAIITTDSHYLRPENRDVHTAFLKSQDAERETDGFYDTTYLMTANEIRNYCDYMSVEEFNNCMKNTIEIADKIEEFDLYETTKVPNAKTIELINNYQNKLDQCNISKYKYIELYSKSQYKIDQILYQQLDLGLKKHNIDYSEEVLNRINLELEALWEISEKLKQRLSSYYILTKEIVEIIWRVSLVGVSRGSAGAFFICYLLDIIQMNPMDTNQPYWRHITKERPELPDIDIDSQAAERGNILKLLKEVYGYDRVLNIATFKTEGAVSAILTIARGVGMPIDQARYLSSLAVKEGTKILSLKKCEKLQDENPKCKKLINELKKMNEEYEGFYEKVRSIEGLICGRSIHASGVYIYPSKYTDMNAMMKAPNGQEITQFSMADSDYMGGLKVDMLTIEALDRMRKCIDLLVKHNRIKWEGSLKATYDKHLHPSVLEYDDPKMWDLLYSGEVINAFQMETNVGRTAVQKVQPHKLQEIVATNSLMRLSCDGEQPIDRFVKHKKDISLWYKEMDEWGLNESEIKILEKYLLKSYGVANTQEDLMLLAMDEGIANFNLVEANKLRKAIAKASAKGMIEPMMNLFIKKGLENGTRMKMLAYVWEIQVKPSYGYAFSVPHTTAYSIVLLQEMNLVYKFGSLFWKVACLSINAGNISEEVNKGSDYGAIARAIGNMPKGFVLPPDINKASMEFEPIVELNKAMYSLNAILSLGEDVCKNIIENRPYSSLEDFMDKCYYTKLVPQTKVINLIKAGSFDNIEGDRVKTMIKFINLTNPLSKKALTTANLPKLHEYNLIPNKYNYELELYLFRKVVFTKSNIIQAINKSTALYKIPNKYLGLFENKYSLLFSDAIEIIEGMLTLNNKKFDKIYKNEIENLNQWLRSNEAANLLNTYKKKLIWDQYCCGSVQKWEMDSICYYSDKHELDFIPISQYFKINNFNTLPKMPEIAEIVRKKNYSYNKYKLNIISGTVIKKDKNHYLITLLTQFGVVDVKLSPQTYSYYDRKVKDDDSWLKRGNILVIIGYRKEETFYPKVYSDSIYSNSIMKIDKYNDKSILFLSQKRE